MQTQDKKLHRVVLMALMAALVFLGSALRITLPVNGMTTTMLYPYNTLTRRNVRVSTTGVRFYGGYERWQDYNLGIINTFELDVPWNAGWTADNGCCIPCYIYGFM